MSPEHKVDIVNEAVKSAPPVAVTAASGLLGLSLYDWMLVATIGYIALQAAWLLWKWRRAAKDKKWTPD